MRINWVRILILLVIICVCAACATQRPIVAEINTFASPGTQIQGYKHFFMLPASKSITPTDLEFEEYARYVSRALVQRGYSPAMDLADADVVVFIGYGIGNPQDNQYSYSIPVFGQTGVQSSNAYGTINSFGSYSTYSGTITYVPTYGITGYQSVSGSYRTYFRYLSVDAYDYAAYKTNKQVTELWITTVTSIGVVDDLRYIMPFLVVAAEPYFGIDTGRKVRIQLADDPTTIALVKN